MSRTLSSGDIQAPEQPAGTQVTVTATDAFDINDPVFIDWKTGTINDLDGILAAAALTAGPATTYFTASDHSASTFASSTSVTLADGSIVIVLISRDAANNYQMVANKYSQKGVLLAKSVLRATGAVTLGNLVAILLSNGNIAVSWISASTTGIWAILSPSLQTLYTGSTTAAIVFHLQATNNGGVVILNSAGIDTVTSAGVKTTTVAATQISPATSDEINNKAITADSSGCYSLTNYRPADISTGGFGYIYYNSTGVYYSQINADGTLRGTLSTLQSWGSQGIASAKYAVSSTGNIMWALSLTLSVGYYGVVGDNGSIAKAGALMTSQIGNGGSIQLVSDANGGFVLITNNATNWNIRYTSSAGVDVATFPKVLAPYVNAYGVKTIKLSTGIVFSCSGTSYDVKYSFIDLVGTFLVNNATLYAFGGGASAQALSAFVMGDTMYGISTAGNGGAVDMVVFAITNAGVLTLATAVLGLSLVPTNPLRLALDQSNQYIHTIASGTSQTVVSTFDLSLNQLQSYTITNVFANAHIRNFGYGFLFCDIGGSGGFSTATPANAAAFVKNKSTVLLGVASGPVAAGGQLTVNTKGLFPAPASWKTAAQSFDHSSNNPPGNKGHINNGVIALTGF
jgi:hypothetical protein